MTYRIRAESATGDMTFGRGQDNFLVNSPAAVAQRARNRLNLWQGDWYLDLFDGLPQLQQILGFKNVALAQALIRDRIAQTPFITSIEDFSVIFNETTRALTVVGKANTAFGALVFDYPLTPLLTQAFTTGVTPLGPGHSGAG